MDEQDTPEIDEKNIILGQAPVSAPASEPEIKETNKGKKQSDFPGQEIEQPSIKETSAEKTEEIEKVRPVIIEWKKPFFLMFGLGVAAIILMLVLK